MDKKVIDAFTVLNEKGLHSRPSAEIVKCTSSFKSRITFHLDNESVNAKSILDILTLTATRGSKIMVEAVGVDAEEAVTSLLELAKEQFGVKY